MIKYAALLRGIGPGNPNMHNDKLRGVFEMLGFKNVQTVISSGNVLFESGSKNIKALETKIEKAFPEQLGFNSTTIIRSYDDIQSLIKKDPFKGINDNAKSRLNVTFLKSIPPAGKKLHYNSPKGDYKIIDIYKGAIFSVVDLSGSKTPDLMIWLEKQFGKEITTRTWKTVNRILKKME
ncbi:MAG: DUF1697 domain-containing protein [Ignavibacteriaceae bacterium]